MRKLLAILFLALFVGQLNAQSYKEVDVPVTDILQYQRTKAKFKDGKAPFGRYGFKRIRATKVLGETDSVRIWGYHVSANLEYDRDKQPLYRLFKRNDWDSMAVIDHFDSTSSPCRLVFWGKKYYRRFASELQRMGFVMRNSKRQTNILEFRKEGVTIGVDVTIWGDVYLLDVLSL